MSFIKLPFPFYIQAVYKISPLLTIVSKTLSISIYSTLTELLSLCYKFIVHCLRYKPSPQKENYFVSFLVILKWVVFTDCQQNIPRFCKIKWVDVFIFDFIFFFHGISVYVIESETVDGHKMSSG